MEYFPIYVVDDDVEDHLMIEQFLAEMELEHTARYFNNGQLVLNHLRDIADDSLLPKLIVLDLNMPILNGTQTLIQIKRNTELAKIPVIIFSTSQNEEERRKCISYGAIDYLVKPMTIEEGKNIIKHFITFL